jgi:CDP-glycerol glycerophosphotransferase (TagB/SpsB family)
MGLDQQKYPASTDMDFDKLLERCDRWDFSLSSNRFSTTVWERVYPCSYVSLESGYPRNDILVNATSADVRRARTALGLADGTRAFLYMPTHREYQPGFEPSLDLARLADELGPDVTLMVRGHYFYGSSPHVAELRRSGRIVDVSGHGRVEELYLAADALITDYSSAMFDYAVLDRPIIIYAPDWDIYSAVRGTYFNLLQESPGAVATTQAELIGLLGSDAYRGEEAAARRDAFRRRFCEVDDGRAAERVVRRVFLGETQPLPFVPFAERSHAPAPTQALATVERA